MAGPSTQADNEARTRLYLGSAKQGTVFNRTFSFYSGKPTTPVSFTGNQILGVASDGPGANIIDGIGPPIDFTVCDEPTLTIVDVTFGDDDTFITVAFEGLQPGDVFVLFNNNGDAYSPSNIQPTIGGLVLTFPDSDLLPAGTYSLKAIRGTLDCFDVVNNIFTITGVTCIVDAGAWTGPGGIPFPPFIFGAGAPISVEIAGSGFLSCTIDVAVEALFGTPPTQAVTSLVVVNDNLITFDVSRVGISSFTTYQARVFCTDFPGCEDIADNTLTYGVF